MPDPRFLPLESPYSGALQACARIREGMALLDKYVSAIELDAAVLSQLPSERAAARHAERDRTAVDDALDMGASIAAVEHADAPRAATPRDGKSWKRRE